MGNRDDEDGIMCIFLIFCAGIALLTVGSVRLADEQTHIHQQKESQEWITFLNVSHELCSEKICENMEMPRDQLNMVTKCADISSAITLNRYQPGQDIACNDGFLCLNYQMVDWTTCYNLRLVNTSQIDCYNTYNCKSISKASNSIDYELECQTYGLIDQSKDCKCSFNRPEVCQLPIDQFNSNCNGQKLCTQPIHDRKCRIKVSECYTIKAKLGFSTLDGNQVITSDQTLTCKSDDIACPQSQISKIEPGKNIWYRSTDGTDWSYESYNPNENCNIAMIVIGGVLILSVCFCCCGVVASAISTGSRSIPEPVRQLNSSNENPIHCLQPQPNLHSSSNEEVQRSQENSIELVERSRQSSEISIQLSKHSSSQSQIF